jgi:pyruvate,orthophosphate dikinase
MQVTAITEAVIACKQKDIDAQAEIMIPLVGTAREFSVLAEQVRKTMDDVQEKKKFKGKLGITVGTMIEVPRAALVADAIGAEADFFSFGTNDLTQMTFGFSRDDINTFLPDYLKGELLLRDPFQTLDSTGVGQLVEMAVQKGRGAKKGLKCGICGEHGGDPDSIVFCQQVGLDYVSCSPFRVPIARLAAAQAALKQSGTDTGRKGE